MLKKIQSRSMQIVAAIFGERSCAILSNPEKAGVPPSYSRTVKAKIARIIAIFNLFAAVLVLYAFHNSEQFAKAIFWFGLFFAANTSTLIRMSMFKGDEKSVRSYNKDAPKVGQNASSSCIINALSWVTLAILLFPNGSVEEQVFLTGLMAGLTGGGVFILSYKPQAAFAYLITFYLGTILTLVITGNPVFYELGVLETAYCFMLLWALRVAVQVQADRIQAAADLEKSNSIVSTLLREYEASGREWLWETDDKGFFINVTNKAEEIVSLQPSVIETLTLDQLFLHKAGKSDDSDSDARENLGKLSAALTTQQPFRDCVVQLNQGTDNKVWCKITGRPHYDRDGRFCGYRGVCLDVSNAKETEEQLRQLAHFDPLSGFHNRGHFTSEIGKIIMHMRAKDEPFALMVMDFNKFRKINDTLGYPAGDAVLIEVASRIREVLVEGDYVARLGADEFAIILPGVGTKAEAARRADALIEAFNRPIDAIGWMINVNISIGITLAPENGWFRVDLLNNAALAHYRAKEDPKSSYHFFSPEMDSQIRERLELEMELREAIRQDQLTLFYQPIFDIKSGNICCYEALIRWQHPKRGMISPAMFIPIAEDSGMIVDIGEMVIYQACKEAASWKNNRRVAVNLSAQQFMGVGLEQVVANALAESGLHPSRLELELTESILVENAEETVTVLRNLRNMGVRIALDDFGTGYSSLLYLVNFQFDKIKIDQSFVKKAERGNDRLEIIRAVIGLAKNLGIRTTAEGVETIDKFHLLAEEGCDEAQGYLISKPVPASQLEQLDREIDNLGIAPFDFEAEKVKPDNLVARHEAVLHSGKTSSKTSHVA